MGMVIHARTGSDVEIQYPAGTVRIPNHFDNSDNEQCVSRTLESLIKC